MQLTEETMITSRRSNKTARGREAQLVELLIDGGFLLNVKIARRNVGFRLVVVVIGDKILDCVVREELLELMIELRGESFIVGEDQRRPVQLLDHLGNGKSFAGAGDAEQHLMFFAADNAANQLINCARLIATRLVVTDKLKVHTSLF